MKRWILLLLTIPIFMSCSGASEGSATIESSSSYASIDQNSDQAEEELKDVAEPHASSELEEEPPILEEIITGDGIEVLNQESLCGTTEAVEKLFDSDSPTEEELENISLTINEIGRSSGRLSALASVPGTDVFLLAELSGIVRQMSFTEEGEIFLSEPVIDLSWGISQQGEGGLLGIAVAKDGSEVYLSYTDLEMKSKVIAYSLDCDTPIAGTSRELLSMQQPETNHNGGNLIIDNEGRLLIGFGDGGGADDPRDYAQDLGNWFGTILRIDPKSDIPYGIPTANPFIDQPEIEPEIIVWGLRNPWRFAIDELTGDLWIGDVGQYIVEEVSRIPESELNLGTNLGWPAFEGARRTGKVRPLEHRLPDIWYNHDDGRCAVVGGLLYRGNEIPSLYGSYIYSDWCDGIIRLAAVQEDGSVATTQTSLSVPQITGFFQGRNREVYVLGFEGGIYRLEVGSS